MYRRVIIKECNVFLFFINIFLTNNVVSIMSRENTVSHRTNRFNQSMIILFIYYTQYMNFIPIPV